MEGGIEILKNTYIHIPIYLFIFPQKSLTLQKPVALGAAGVRGCDGIWD